MTDQKNSQALAIAYAIRKKRAVPGAVNKDRVADVIRRHTPIGVKAKPQAPQELESDDLLLDNDIGLPEEVEPTLSESDKRKQRITQILSNMR